MSSQVIVGILLYLVSTSIESNLNFNLKDKTHLLDNKNFNKAESNFLFNDIIKKCDKNGNCINVDKYKSNIGNNGASRINLSINFLSEIGQFGNGSHQHSTTTRPYRDNRDSSLNCANNYINVNDKCVCPEPYVEINNKCEKKTAPSSMLQCNENEILKNGKCKCIAGYKKVQGKCMTGGDFTTTSPPPVPRCPNDAILIYGICQIKTTPPPIPSCRYDEKLISGRCQPKTTPPPVPHCGYNEVLVNGRCTIKTSTGYHYPTPNVPFTLPATTRRPTTHYTTTRHPEVTTRYTTRFTYETTRTYRPTPKPGYYYPKPNKPFEYPKPSCQHNEYLTPQGCQLKPRPSTTVKPVVTVRPGYHYPRPNKPFLYPQRF